MQSYIISLVALLSLNAPAAFALPKGSSMAGLSSDGSVELTPPRLSRFCAAQLAASAEHGEEILASDEERHLSRILEKVRETRKGMPSRPWTREFLGAYGLPQYVVNESKAKVREGAASAQNKVADVYTSGKDKLADGGRAVKRVVVKGVDSAKGEEAAKPAVDEAKSAASKMSAAAKAKAQAAADAVKRSSRTVDEKLGLSEKAKAAKDKTAETASKGAKSAKEAAAKGAETVDRYASRAAVGAVDKAYTVREKLSAIPAEFRLKHVHKIKDGRDIFFHIANLSEPEAGLDKATARLRVSELTYLERRLAKLDEAVQAQENQFVMKRTLKTPSSIKAYLDQIIDDAQAMENQDGDDQVAMDQEIKARRATQEPRATFRDRVSQKIKSFFTATRASKPAQFLLDNKTALAALGFGAGAFATSQYTGQSDTVTAFATIGSAALPFVWLNKTVRDFTRRAYVSTKTFIYDNVIARPSVQNAAAWTKDRAGRATAWTKTQLKTLRYQRAIQIIRADQQIKNLREIRQDVEESPLNHRLIYNSFEGVLTIEDAQNFDPLNPKHVRELVQRGIQAERVGLGHREMRVRVELVRYRGQNQPQLDVFFTKLGPTKTVEAHDDMISVTPFE